MKVHNAYRDSLPANMLLYHLVSLLFSIFALSFSLYSCPLRIHREKKDGGCTFYQIALLKGTKKGKFLQYLSLS